MATQFTINLSESHLDRALPQLLLLQITTAPSTVHDSTSMVRSSESPSILKLIYLCTRGNEGKNRNEIKRLTGLEALPANRYEPIPTLPFFFFL